MPKIIGEKTDPNAIGPSPYIVEKDDGTQLVLPRYSVPAGLRNTYETEKKAAAAQAEADAQAQRAADEKLRLETQGPNANDFAHMTKAEGDRAKADFAARQANSLAVPEQLVSVPPEELVSRQPPVDASAPSALAVSPGASPAAAAAPSSMQPGTGGSGYSETQVLRPAASAGLGMVGAGDIRAGTRMQAAGIDAFSQASEREGLARAAQADAQRVQLEAMDAKEAERQARVVAQRDEQMAKISRLTDSLAKEDGSISNSRWWNSRSTGQKVLATMSAALAGFAGTTSPVFKFIDDDIAAQKDALDRRRDGKKDALAGANSLLAVMRTNGLDDAQAQLAARAGYLQRAALEVDRLTANSSNEKVRANGEKMKGEILAKQGETLAQLADRVDNRNIQRETLNLQRAEAMFKLQAGGKADGELNRQAAAYGKDQEDVAKLRGAVATLRKAASSKGDVPGAGVWDSRKPDVFNSREDTAVRQAKSQAGALVLKTLSGSGASDAERANVLRSFGLHDGASEAETRIGLEALEKELGNTTASNQSKYDPEAIRLYAQRFERNRPLDIQAPPPARR